MRRTSSTPAANAAHSTAASGTTPAHEVSRSGCTLRKTSAVSSAATATAAASRIFAAIPVMGFTLAVSRARRDSYGLVVINR